MHESLEALVHPHVLETEVEDSNGENRAIGVWEFRVREFRVQVWTAP